MREKRSVRARAPQASSPRVRHLMQSVRQGGTDPEAKLHSELRQRGLQPATDTRPVKALRITPDFVFVEERVCVFVDGCFWHGCPEHFTLPSSNSAWWREKLAETTRRDQRQSANLTKAGWLVLRVWEHESLADAADSVAEAITARSQHSG